MDAALERQDYAKGVAVRERIIEGAVQRIAALGYGASTVAQLAAAAQVSKNQLFHHFGAKEAIARAALDKALSAWRSRIATSAGVYPGAEERLLFAAGQLGELEATGWPHLRLIAVLLAERDGLPAALASELEAAIAEIHGFFRLAVKDLRREGRLALGQKARPLAGAVVAALLGRALMGSLGDGYGDAQTDQAILLNLLSNPAAEPQ